jgi:hypothetical protein
MKRNWGIWLIFAAMLLSSIGVTIDPYATLRTGWHATLNS